MTEAAHPLKTHHALAQLDGPPSSAGFGDQRRIRQFFFLSQGSVGQMEKLFQWSMAHNMLPPGDDPYSIPGYLRTLVIPKGHVSITSLDLVEAWQTLVKVRREARTPSPTQLTQEILHGLAGRDLRYLVIGRTFSPDEQDPFKSYLRQHVVQGQTAGLTDFSTLFASLRDSLEGFMPIDAYEGDILEDLVVLEIKHALSGSHGNWSDKNAAAQAVIDGLETGKLLQITSAMWEERHPNESFFPKALLA